LPAAVKLNFVFKVNPRFVMVHLFYMGRPSFPCIDQENGLLDNNVVNLSNPLIM